MTSRLRSLRATDLSDTSRWVWVALALAAASFAVGIWGSSQLTLQTIYSSFASATPALFAAALMFVAPNERLVRISAFAFAFPVAVSTLLSAAISLASPNLSGDYAYLAPRLISVSDAFGTIGWVFPILAVWCLAYYIGPIEGRLGWLIVTAGAAIAVIDVLDAAWSGAMIQASAYSIIIAVIAQSAWIAWAYLLAVAVTKRMLLISVAAATHIAGGVTSLIAIPIVQSLATADPNTPSVPVLLALLWILSVTAWATLIAGILRELPRGTDEPAVSSPKVSSKRSLSAGR